MKDLVKGDIIKMFEPDNETPILYEEQTLMRVTSIIEEGKIEVDTLDAPVQLSLL